MLKSYVYVSVAIPLLILIRSSKTLAAAKINGVSLDVVETRAIQGDTKKPEYLKKWPMGKIPAFEGTDGFQLIEGRAIARYSEYSRSHIGIETCLLCMFSLKMRRNYQLSLSKSPCRGLLA